MPRADDAVAHEGRNLAKTMGPAPPEEEDRGILPEADGSLAGVRAASSGMANLRGMQLSLRAPY